MKVYANEYEWFVADNPDDLKKIYEDHYGATVEEMDCDLTDFVEVDPEFELSIRIETDDFDEKQYPESFTIDKNKYPGYWVLVTGKIKDWIIANGKGFLCSTEE
jgi:hypothetical protein